MKKILKRTFVYGKQMLKEDFSKLSVEQETQAITILLLIAHKKLQSN